MTDTPAPSRSVEAIDAHFLDRQRMWRGGWRRYVFPGLWLVYCAQTVNGVHNYSHGAAAIIGYAIVVAFCACYLVALPCAWTGQARRFARLYALACVLTVAEMFFARSDAFVFCVYVAVLTIAGLRRYALPVVVAMTIIIVFLPRLLSWQKDIDFQSGLTVLLVSFAMYGFFSIIQSNIELADARSEVARLAAENERSRIARDLHDLLGHSLTTITVKASLAHRLSELGETERAASEIAAVEELSRRSLADVRAAVSGYRDVTLAGELATSREVLRAAGVSADFPGAVDIVDADLHELFGWVVREGVTNVVRHARANRCAITVGPTWVEIVDDGRGGIGGPGNGLTGLRERVDLRGGTVESGGCPPGWRLRVDVPAARRALETPETSPTMTA